MCRLSDMTGRWSLLVDQVGIVVMLPSLWNVEESLEQDFKIILKLGRKFGNHITIIFTNYKLIIINYGCLIKVENNNYFNMQQITLGCRRVEDSI